MRSTAAPISRPTRSAAPSNCSAALAAALASASLIARPNSSARSMMREAAVSMPRSTACCTVATCTRSRSIAMSRSAIAACVFGALDHAVDARNRAADKATEVFRAEPQPRRRGFAGGVELFHLLAQRGERQPRALVEPARHALKLDQLLGEPRADALEPGGALLRRADADDGERRRKRREQDQRDLVRQQREQDVPADELGNITTTDREPDHTEDRTRYDATHFAE